MMEWLKNNMLPAAAGLLALTGMILTIWVDGKFILLLFLALFALPLLRELGLTRDADERQRHDQHRASQLAFYSIMLYAIALIIERLHSGAYLPPALGSIVIIGLMFVAIQSFASVLGARAAASVIVLLQGGLWLVITVQGFFGPGEILQFSAGGLLLIALGLLSFRFQLLSGLGLAGAALLFLLYPVNIFAPQFGLDATLFMLLLFSVPPGAAAWMLLSERIAVSAGGEE